MIKLILILSLPAFGYTPVSISTDPNSKNIMEMSLELNRQNLTDGGTINQNLTISSSAVITGDMRVSGALTIDGLTTVDEFISNDSSTFTAQVNMTDGIVIGAATTDKLQASVKMYMISGDVAAVAADCLVTIRMSGDATTSFAMFASTTSTDRNGPFGVTQSGCEPSKPCLVAYSGMARIATTEAMTLGQYIKTTTTRCKAATTTTAATSSGARVLSTTGGAGNVWVLLGGP